MKWVKFKAAIEKSKFMPPDGFFEIPKKRDGAAYDDAAFEKDLDEYAKHNRVSEYHTWGYVVVIASTDSNEVAELLAPYELYAGGWLDFWDTVVRQDSTNHALYFRKSICDGKTTVTAYIKNLNAPIKITNKYVSIVNPPASTDPPPPPSNKPPY
jgi:hypothetical protein